MDSATAIAIPGSTPSSATPANAATDSRHSALRCRHNRTVPGMSASDSDAVITTAARAGLGRFRNRPGTSTIITMITTAPVTPVSWVLAPDRSATAVRDPLVLTGNPWNKPGGQVRHADPDHLAVAVDLLPGAGGERRRRGDRVGQGYQGDPGGPGEQGPEVGRADVRDGERREPLRKHPNQV